MTIKLKHRLIEIKNAKSEIIYCSERPRTYRLTDIFNG